MTPSIDQQFVEFVVKSLVGKPEAVRVDRRIDEKGVLLELTVDPEDLGRVIGKRGATAQSIRTLLRALGTKNEARYNLKIVDVDRLDADGNPLPDGGRQSRPADDSQRDADGADDTRQDNDAAADTASPFGSSDDDDSFATAQQRQTDKKDEHQDAVSRTRAELADLDDLDI